METLRSATVALRNVSTPLKPTAMRALNPVYSALPTTIFEHMSGLARSSGAINLGQGFPDAPPPPALTAAVPRLWSAIDVLTIAIDRGDALDPG